jgi:hypothetical protein
MFDGRRLELDAVDLLLSIAESPGMAISSIALNDFHNLPGKALVAAGALQPDDFEAVAASQAEVTSVKLVEIRG